MDYAALRAEILTGAKAAECAPYVINYDAPKDPNYRSKDQAIVDILNSGDFVGYRERFITARSMLAELDPTIAATVLDKLEAAGASIPAVKWAMKYITSDGIDIGHVSTRAMLQSLANADVLTQGEVDQMLALAARSVGYAESVLGAPVTWADVSIALRGGAAFDPRA